MQKKKRFLLLVRFQEVMRIIRWEDQGKTVIEGDADSEISKRFFELAEKLLEEEAESVR